MMLFDGQSDIQIINSTIADNRMQSIVFVGYTPNHRTKVNMQNSEWRNNVATNLLNLEGVICEIVKCRFEDNDATALRIQNSDLNVTLSSFGQSTRSPVIISILDNGVDLNNEFAAIFQLSHFLKFFSSLFLHHHHHHNVEFNDEINGEDKVTQREI